MATQEGYQPPVQSQAAYQQQYQQQNMQGQQPQQVVYVQPQGQQPNQGQQVVYQQQPAQGQQVVYQQQPAQGQQPQIIVVQPAPTQPILASTKLPFKPTIVTCPTCKANAQTRVRYESGLATWLACGGVFFLGGFCGCCLIPFCIDDLKDTYHSCSQCGAYIGVRKAM
eukprot:868103_1